MDPIPAVQPIDAAPWGEREGPCVIQYRDATWYEHPCRRSFSCLGCRHLRLSFEVHEGSEYSETYCAHPRMIEDHEVPQFNGGGRFKAFRMVQPWFCPVLPDDTDCPQPEPELIDKLSPSYPASPAQVFKLPQIRGAWDRGDL